MSENPHGAEVDDKCPTCGDVLKSWQGVMAHHAQVHGESLAKKEYTCDYCGDSFRRHAKKAEANDGAYCSRSCGAKAPSFDPGWRELKNKYHYEGKSDYELAEIYGVTPPTVTAARERHGIEARKSYDIPELHIPQYLEWAYVKQRLSQREIAEEIGAGQDSVGQALRREGIETRGYGRSGEEHWDWQGGVAGTDSYGVEWPRRREEALQRDGYQCRSCGMTNAEHNAEYGRDLDVHHVVPVRKFDDPEDAHSLGNLVSACRSCHGKYEGMPVFPK